ncbi:hypothetical protein [Paraburkholderia oxyphila]|nr:hypothetical protein [Paraburkholderia oxyphila]
MGVVDPIIADRCVRELTPDRLRVTEFASGGANEEIHTKMCALLRLLD